MKYSIYNSVIQLDGSKCLLYNSLKDNFTLLNESTANRIKENDSATIKDIPIDTYNKLQKLGVIVDDHVDELQNLIQISDSICFDDSKFTLTINPTINCNFNCWYCYETHVKESKMNDAVLEQTKRLISNTIHNQKSLKAFQLSFFGGEPLLYFKSIVKPLMIHAQTACQENNIKFTCSFTTNGYLINDEMTEWFSKFDHIGFQITLDGNKEHHDTIRFPAKGVGSYETIFNNLKRLLRNNCHVLLRLNYTNKNIDTFHQIKEDLMDIGPKYLSNFTVNLQRVWQDASNGDIEVRVADLMKQLGAIGITVTDMSSSTIFEFCYADMKNQLLVNYNGDIFKCTARDFSKVKREGYLTQAGEVVWENDILNKRLTAKFKNKPCLECRILPLCGGGCSQQYLESAQRGESFCLYNYDENAKDKVILDRFYATFVANQPQK